MTNQDLLITRIKQLSEEEISALLDAATIMLGKHSIGAKPDAEELSAVFASLIADGTLVLCDGLRSYNALPAIANCTLKDCTQMAEDEKCFYHLNTVNGFHSFIKSRYNFYRGVATKYLNRYNTLFFAAYRNVTDVGIPHISRFMYTTAIIPTYPNANAETAFNIFDM